MKNHDPVETIPNDFRETLAILEQKLRGCEDSASLIDGLLEGTAQFYGADRAYIIEADWELGIGLNTYEWCQPGVEHQKDMLQFMTMEGFPRWRRFLVENKPVIIPDTEGLKAEYPDEYEFFTKYGVRSLLCAPYSKRINQGYVGVDNPTRFQDDPTFLFIMCYAIAVRLNTEGCLPPSNYKKETGEIRHDRLVGSGHWQTRTVNKVLRSEVYTGDLVQGKTKNIDHRQVIADRDNYITVQNTHEAIISHELFDEVQ